MADDERVLITYDDILKKGWPLSRMHTHRLIQQGKFPKPFKAYDGGRRNMWLEADIDAYLKSRARADKPKPTPAAARK